MTTSQARLLVLGASSLQVPAIRRARDLGHKVAVLDWDGDAPGVGFGDAFYEVSTRDCNGVLAAATDFRADGVITIGTDQPMRALSYACTRLGLRSPTEEAAFRATDKIAMHEALYSHGVPVPRSVMISSYDGIPAAPELEFPVIVKPADSSGSRGVVEVNRKEDFVAAYEYAVAVSQSGSVIVQELLVGHEVSVEGFCVGLDPHLVTITDKVTTGAPHFVELGHSQPTQLKSDDAESVLALVRGAVQALGLSDCAIHAEIMVTSTGPRVIEIGARLGGDFITSHLVPLSTGVDMIGGLINIALGRRPILVHSAARGSAIRFIDHKVTADHQNYLANLDGVVEVVIEESKDLDAIRSSADRFGHIITTDIDAKSAICAANEAIRALSSLPDGS